MENKELEALLHELAEINYNNYGQDEVIALQNWALEAYNKLALLGDEPQPQYTAIDMTTAAAQGFRDAREGIRDRVLIALRDDDSIREPGRIADLVMKAIEGDQ